MYETIYLFGGFDAAEPRHLLLAGGAHVVAESLGLGECGALVRYAAALVLVPELAGHGGDEARGREVEGPACGLGVLGGCTPERERGGVGTRARRAVDLVEEPRGLVRPGEEVVNVGRADPLDEFDACGNAEEEVLAECGVRGVGGSVGAAAGLGPHAVAAGGDRAAEEFVDVGVAVDGELPSDLKLKDCVDEVAVGRVAHVLALVAHADLAVADLAHGGGEAGTRARVDA